MLEVNKYGFPKYILYTGKPNMGRPVMLRYFCISDNNKCAAYRSLQTGTKIRLSLLEITRFKYFIWM